ncbi:hypothetical protein JVU11DRAFT_7790 [Chiua virens]|nr:hypothetical protein JVU11DRAFT_7790 [Chiua virens]
MKGYLAFPPLSSAPKVPLQLSETDPTSACTTWSNQPQGASQSEDSGDLEEKLEGERRRRREQERALSERSEVEWVRAGGVLRDASGRRDRVRTERIRQELQLQDMEGQRIVRWEASETRWRTIQSSPAPITFVDFPWPLAEHVSSRDLNSLTRRAISNFLFESLAVRGNATTKRERIRSALLRWHPDKISVLLSRVVSDDLELVREGIHVVFGILKSLQVAERTGVL